MKDGFTVALLAMAIISLCLQISPSCALTECGDCDDKNPCTKDYCGPKGCVHEPIDCGNGRASSPAPAGPSEATAPAPVGSADTAGLAPASSPDTAGLAPVGSADTAGLAPASSPETTGPAPASPAEAAGPASAGSPETTGLTSASSPEAAGPAPASSPEAAGPASISLQKITSPASSNSSGKINQSSNGRGEITGAETTRFQDATDTQANTAERPASIQTNNMNDNELGGSETSPSADALQPHEILEHKKASIVQGIDGQGGEPGPIVTDFIEPDNQSTRDLLEIEENDSIPESMRIINDSSILQSQELFMNNSNESVENTHSPPCDDNDACTTDTWNGEGCVYTPISCDDQNESTVDYCLNGLCVHSLKECDDGNACTIDTWNGNECVHTPGNCDDGNPCTAESCVNGTCTHKQKSCDDGDPCTIDSCVNGECIHKQKSCDDGNPCTIDSCVNGKCIHKQKSCDDGNACTIDACDGRGKCVHLWRSCDDGNPCTIDECDPYWGCIHTPVVCGAGRRCVNGVCQPVSTPTTSPTSYTIPAGSSINLPWGASLTAVGYATVENGIAYASGQRFSRQLGYGQTAISAEGTSQATESVEMVGLSWQNSPLTMTLIRPDGRILSPESDSQNINHFTGTNYDYYFLRDPAKGIWNIEIRPINAGAGGESFSLITGLVSGDAFKEISEV